MDIRSKRLSLAGCGIAFLALAGCGGGGGDSPAPAPSPPATTSVHSTVVDGAIKNALVCLDKNSNGKCDSGEVQGRTDINGDVTLEVPNADVGQYPIVAVVGTDAVDADHGAVTTAYTLSAPADRIAVVSALTTLVQQTVATTGSSSADAAKSVQDAIGLTVSPFQDFTKVAAPTDGSISAATVARMLIVTTQQQTTAIAGTVGTSALDGSTITQADIDRAIQKKLIELLPDVVAAVADPAVAAAATAAAKEQALQDGAQALVTSSGLTASGVATVVAVDHQTSTTTTVTAPVIEASFSLRALTFTDASNYLVRVFTASAAQNTPDSNNKVKFVDRRHRSAGGHLANWGTGLDPLRGADLHWNGSTWVNCPINFENTSSVRDARGNSTYDYCDGYETGSSNRASFDIAGKTMTEVYAQVRGAGYTNLYIANTSALGTATFPTGSLLLYQASTPLTEALSYYPGGSDPAGTSNVISQYSALVSAGGNASAQGAGVACNASETTGNGTNTATLETMIALASGTPCVFTQGSFVYGGVTYTSDVPNEWWGNSTVGIGIIGTAPLGVGPAPGYYSGNAKLRIAFKGTGTNPVTYYSCKERFNNGSTRNCTVIGTGSYTITTLGDARVMTLNSLPLQTAPLNYTRVFVERGGLIYSGYQSKPIITNTSRLNTVAASALFTQLGLPAETPSVPLALTAGSYQGVWDMKDSTAATTANGTTVFVGANGDVSCQDRATSSFMACSLSITDPSTGAFTFAIPGDGSTASGSLNFLAGTASGTYHDPTSSPTDGSFVAKRR